MSEQANVFQQDARLQTRRVTPELIAYIVEKIAREVSPQRIIMFGSRARGQAAEDSDIDLFVIQDSQMLNRQVRRRIERLLWGREFGVDLIVRTPPEVERNMADGNPFYTRHIFGEGRVLYERPGQASGGQT